MHPGPHVCIVITLVAEDGFAWQTVASTLVYLHHSRMVTQWNGFEGSQMMTQWNSLEGSIYLAAHMNWDDKMNAKKLPTLLEGEAIAVWFELTSEEQESYSIVKVKITEQMVPAYFVSLANFHKRILQPGECLSVFTHELKWLLKQALPTADADTSKQLLLHQFINGLSSSLSTQLRVASQIDD